MTKHELEYEIRALVEASIEDTRVPDAIAAHADKRAGKPVTKTDAEQLEEQLGVPVRIRRQYGLTHVAWAVGDGQNPWRDERSILLARAETGARWPKGEELRASEPAHFGARDERNAARRAILSEYFHPGHHSKPSAIERAARAITKLREAREELARLIDHDQPLGVVRFAIQKLAEKG